MVVGFWSFKPGQSGTTINMSAISSMLAIKYLYHNVILSTRFEKSTLDRLFLENEYLETVSPVNTGVDALFKYMSNQNVDKETFSNFTTSIIARRLDLLLSTTNVNEEIYHKNFESVIEEYVEFIKTRGEFAFIDLEAGFNCERTSKVLGLCDLIVININQNTHGLNEMYNTKEFIDLVESKNVLFVVGNYDESSELNVKNLARRYGIPKDLICVVPYNRNYADYCNNSKCVEYMLENLKGTKKEDNFVFIKSIEDIVHRILSMFDKDKNDYLAIRE